MRQNLQTRSGNRIVVVFDGKQIGLIQSVDMNDDYAPEPASGIGDIHVTEYVPTMARHSLNVSAMMLNRGAMLQAGIAMENGDAVLQGLVFDFEAYSKDDGTLLRKYVGCSYASGNIQISKHSIVVQSGMFNALDVTGLAA
ncbi:hypothetical protein [Bordetella phage vB_BbrM_PHB04]|uniref:Tail protein n=1 Tax=Bordetella phage vB_BbrM_PHB04 TaxID=2029657 RepID=A0A291L9V7_9CAUD|nr:virion structural protein [Bordetella phage vB_BbrM_PHB04]ATI15629.1 hypothetical protein [Bordetella phage vB_BbrM_PHB04]